MKKILLSAITVLALSLSVNAQAYMEGFEGTNLPTGWDSTSNSGPIKGVTPSWFSSSNFATPPPAQEGVDFFVSNYQAVAGTGDISTWLFTPTRTMNNGDAFSFYTETLGNPVQYPDRMEIRLSTNGTSTNVGSTTTSVGDYSVALGVINPSLTLIGYPNTWTYYSYTLSGLPGAGVSGRFAFRYYVTNGGPTGANSDAVGIDSVYYQPAIAMGISSAKNNGNFKIYPNPSTGLVKLTFATPAENRLVIVQNMLGEVLYNETVNSIENSIDFSSYAKGVYLVNIKENGRVRTEKLTIQ